MSVIVNDVHSKLNKTEVSEILTPVNLEELKSALSYAKKKSQPLAICGFRHAMGSQQFIKNGLLLDTRKLTRIINLDADKGLIKAEAGIDWPTLIEGYTKLQTNNPNFWGIRQKQTGADRLSLGGALSANIHGRGLKMSPIISDIESFELLNAENKLITCSRSENPEIFKLAIGGYGLFGIIYSVTLRLAKRQVLRRLVRVIDIEDAVNAAARRIEEGYIYGDFQFDIDPSSPDFLTKGVFSGYKPVENAPSELPIAKELSPEDWANLIDLAHLDKKLAFQKYAQHYLATDGQLYYSDTHQLSTYLDDYHVQFDKRTGAEVPASEVISELYVPPEKLVEFLKIAARSLTKSGVPVIYGTIRLIEEDKESFLPWAKKKFACVIFNLHIEHSEEGVSLGAAAFRNLITESLRLGGSFFLTYHRYANKEQILEAYPQMPEFIKAKLRFDPKETFQSEWYQWLKRMI